MSPANSTPSNSTDQSPLWCLRGTYVRTRRSQGRGFFWGLWGARGCCPWHLEKRKQKERKILENGNFGITGGDSYRELVQSGDRANVHGLNTEVRASRTFISEHGQHESLGPKDVENIPDHRGVVSEAGVGLE